jgi:4-hydroxyphenylpyruvate dioxygenase
MTRHLRSIATVCLSGGLADKLDSAARVGFDGVEIFENDLLTFDGSPADIRLMAEDLGLAITLFQPFRDFEAMPENQRARLLDRAERKFDVMEQLGTDLVLVCSNTQAASVDDDARAAADLRAMAERAAARGMRVGYEALAWGRNVNRWGHGWRIVQAADHPALGLIVDSFHTLAIGDDPDGIAGLPGDRVFFVQLADAPLLSMDVLSLSRHYRNFPGQGELDVARFLRAVAASGYTGPLSLEVFNDSFRSAPSRMIGRDGLRSLALVEAEAGLVPLPPPPQINGVEFVEFAVDEVTGEALGGMLRTLGFHHAGQHKSKAVELFRQGGINLVLNREPDSAASEHFQWHGPSVCALALRVDDVAAAMVRAEAMQCPEWRGPVGEGERRIPAVRAPDGMLIHLVQLDASDRSIWEDDFELMPDPQPTGEPHLDAGLSSIDHIAEALPANSLHGAVLFWRAVFGLEAAAPVDLADPFGLVHSRAMVSRGGAFRLPLNVSDSGDTMTGRFVSTSHGAGVQHIAFATPDVAEAVSALRGRAPMLTIAENYYDDLAARWGLDDAALAAMKRLHLLYDREPGGEFIHAYTDTFDGRLFFELVERRGSVGFGAANATFRLAAQASRVR